MHVLAGVFALLAGIGVAQALAAGWLVRGFGRRALLPVMVREGAPPTSPAATEEGVDGRPSPTMMAGITVLKPLYGDEPLLRQALSSLFVQDYPRYQIVFGVSNPADKAADVVRELRLAHHEADIALVVDSTRHGKNRKVGNLINMLPVAKHDILVIADSDVHARPDYLSRLAEALDRPGVGLVTTLYAGLPDHDHQMRGVTLPARLGATAITHGFLPSAVLARRLGRQDCLGATMCLRRGDLERIGGFRALVDHLADDNVLGRRIAALGLRVALADTVPLTTVPETSIKALFRHELRWARTIRALEPVGFAASILQYPLFWALLGLLASGGGQLPVALFGLAWVLRAVAATWVDHALAPLWPGDQISNTYARLAFSCPVWLLPLRDLLSVVVMLASYGGRHVVWRGQGMQADTPPPADTTREA